MIKRILKTANDNYFRFYMSAVTKGTDTVINTRAWRQEFFYKQTCVCISNFSNYEFSINYKVEGKEKDIKRKMNGYKKYFLGAGYKEKVIDNNCKGYFLDLDNIEEPTLKDYLEQ